MLDPVVLGFRLHEREIAHEKLNDIVLRHYQSCGVKLMTGLEQRCEFHLMSWQLLLIISMLGALFQSAKYSQFYKGGSCLTLLSWVFDYTREELLMKSGTTLF